MQPVPFVHGNIKRYLRVNMNKLDERHFWIPDVLDIAEQCALMFAHNPVNRIIYPSLFIFHNVIEEDCDINIPIRQVQLCSKRAKVLNFGCWVLFDNHGFDPKVRRECTFRRWKGEFSVIALRGGCIRRTRLFSCGIAKAHLTFILWIWIATGWPFWTLPFTVSWRLRSRSIMFKEGFW